MQQKEGVYSSFSFDESNHGQYPEYFVCVPSVNFPLILPLPPKKLIDIKQGVIKPRKPYFEKQRAHHNCSLETIAQEHTFLELTELDKKRIKNQNLWGIVIASLIQKYPVSDYTIFYIDGKIPESEKVLIIRTACGILGKDPGSFEISCGVYLDQRVEEVNAADKLAHLYFTYNRENDCNPQSLQKLHESPNRRELLSLG